MLVARLPWLPCALETLIQAINGESTELMTHLEAQNRIQGLPGPPPTLSVSRCAQGRPQARAGGESGEANSGHQHPGRAGPHSLSTSVPLHPRPKNWPLTGVWQALLWEMWVA